MKKLLLLLCFLAFTQSTDAQRNCGSHDHFIEQMESNPQMQLNYKAINAFTKKYVESQDRADGTIITIPVVVHVVYKTNAQNISNAQIISQIDVLNDDFRRTNSDADNYWGNLGADTEIDFCLASVDPGGNVTDGIQRRKTNKPSFGTNDNMKFNNKGGLDAWPAADYLNIWVCNISGGILGYAQFPGGPAATDGVVCDYQYFGTIGTATAPFDLGRTATHEVGHWLNLRHIWGDGGCTVDDFVGDTPVSDGPNYGCTIGVVSCGTEDMVQNYMDYSDDVCMNLFTTGQADRMNALFAPGGFRESLTTSNGCGGGSGPTCSDGIQNGDEEGVDCGGSNCDPCGGGGTCDVPGGQFANSIKAKKAKLNWSSVGAAVSYNVQVSIAGQSNWTTYSTSSTSKTVSGLSNGQSYDWRVEAVCSGETSGYSGICNFTAGNSGSGDCAARMSLEIQAFELFPNPTSDRISVAQVSRDNAKSVQIINTNGRIISRTSVEQAINGIDVSLFEAGMYLMKVDYIDNSSQIKRFIVIK